MNSPRGLALSAVTMRSMGCVASTKGDGASRLSFHALYEFSKRSHNSPPSSRQGSPDNSPDNSPKSLIRANRHTISDFRETPEAYRGISPRDWQSSRPVIGNTIEISPHAKWQEHVPDKTHPSAPSYGAIESSPPDSPESPKWSTELDWVFALFVFLVFGSQVRCSFVWVLA